MPTESATTEVKSSPELETPAVKPEHRSTSSTTSRPKSTLKIPSLTSLMNSESKSETNTKEEKKVVLEEPFTDEQLRSAWLEFAENRKIYQAEYQLLTQEYEIRNHQMIVRLYSPVQETMLNTLKGDITTFLREKLRNNTIQVIGELLESSERKVLYTNREKFDHLVEKNPLLKEMKDRLGLDTDF